VSISLISPLSRNANTPLSTLPKALNELYRSRAEKAGIVYVDIWDGFVDESGRYSPDGPDFEGQIRRLRSSDGVVAGVRLTRTARLRTAKTRQRTWPPIT
jgi:hypothetical protein